MDTGYTTQPGQPLPPPPIRFTCDFIEALQLVFIEYELVEKTIDPSILKVIPSMGQLPTLPPKWGVIISGRGPTWLTAFLLHLYHYGYAMFSYDPRLGAVCVGSHKSSVYEGFIIPPQALGK